jgi:DNA-binding PadR family transcriptional regulator
MKQILPLRFGILYTIHLNQEINHPEIMIQIEPYYGKERQFNLKEIENHLDALKAAGLIEETKSMLNEKNELINFYKITDEGKDRLKYLPS